MKNLTKKISLLLIFALVLSISFGCTPKEDVQKKLYTNSGFLSSKSTEDNKNYVEIAANGENIKLEVKDNNIFKELVEDEYYMVAYDEDSILKSAEVNEFLKKLVMDSMKQGIEVEEGDKFTISPSESKDYSDLTLLDQSKIDYNNDGTEETISLYTVAGRGPDGEMAWDDGQNWILVVRDNDKDYVLFENYVQLGAISFYAYFEDDDFVITTIQSGTANLIVTEYRLDKDSNNFIGTIKFSTKGNVNMFHQLPLKY